MTRIAVIIPTWNGAAHLRRLLPALHGQRRQAAEILVIDSSSNDEGVEIARAHGCRVEVIPKAEFNHGGTRNRAAAMVDANCDLLVFMTQDALPVDAGFLEELVRPLEEGRADAAYARQRPYPQASPGETFARGWNYPPNGELKTVAEVAHRGMRAYFFSNVASAVSRSAFQRLGGFPERVVMNEDMLFCARLLVSGGTVAYTAAAQVFHSHEYSLVQQFRRYFDIGAFLADHRTDLPGAHATGHGISFVLRQVAHLLRSGHPFSVLYAGCEALVKFIAFHSGRRHRFLPRSLKRRLSMHAFFWR